MLKKDTVTYYISPSLSTNVVFIGAAKEVHELSRNLARYLIFLSVNRTKFEAKPS
jgi:hypothetical protein